MVMRNRRDGGGSAGGWDDLPPRVRDRFTRPPAVDAPTELPVPPEPPAPAGPGLIPDLTRLALAVLAAVATCLAVLFVALLFLSGGPLPIPGR